MSEAETQSGPPRGKDQRERGSTSKEATAPPAQVFHLMTPPHSPRGKASHVEGAGRERGEGEMKGKDFAWDDDVDGWLRD